MRLRYYLELLITEILKLNGSKGKKVNKDKRKKVNNENVPHWEIVDVLIGICNITNKWK